MHGFKRWILVTMIAAGIVTSADAVTNDATGTPVTDSFETYGLGVALTGGTNGWYASDAEAAIVTNVFYKDSTIYSNSYSAINPYPINTYTHDAATKVLSLLDGCVTNLTIASNEVNTFVWIDTILQPTLWTEETPPSGATNSGNHLTMYFDSNGVMNVYFTTNVAVNSGQGEDGWAVFNTAKLTTNQWIRLTLKMDYFNTAVPFSRKYFQIFVNGVQQTNEFGYNSNQGANFLGVEGGMWFAISDATALQMSKMIMKNTAVIDDLVITTNEIFSGVTHSITSTATAGGLITPAGIIQAPDGPNFTFNFFPDPGFAVSNLVIDGVTNYGAASSYTFVNVTNTHSIHANFASTGGETSTTNGVPHAWLAQYGISTDDDTGDTDMDGQKDWEEYYAGTIPTDSNSLFQILDQWVTNGNYIVCWLGSTNGSTNAYHMLCSTNLADEGAWTEVALVPKTPPTTNYWTNAVSVSPISYRIQVDAP